MRLAILFAALLCASAGAATARAESVREDRYGSRAPQPVADLGQAYGGPVLGWSGKRDIAPPDAPPVPVHVQAPPMRRAAQPSRPAQPSHPAQAYAAPVPPPYSPPNAAVGGRIYSVGREFGLTPDPLPPQVMTGPSALLATADWLSAPSGDEQQPNEADDRAASDSARIAKSKTLKDTGR